MVYNNIYTVGITYVIPSNNFNSSTIENCLKYLQSLQIISLDTETTGLCPHSKELQSIQLGDADRQYVINTSTVNILLFKEILESKTLIIQNAKFDLKFLFKHGIYPKKIYDTMLAEIILNTGYEKEELKISLKHLVKKYCNVELDKEIRGKIITSGLTDDVILYAAKDIIYLEDILYKQLDKIHELDLKPILDLENKAVIVFAKMEFDGVKIDVTKWNDVSIYVEEELNNIKKNLDNYLLSEEKFSKFVPDAFQPSLFGDEVRKLNINWSSPMQKVKVLKSLGIKTESAATNILITNNNVHPIIGELVSYSKHEKLRSSFGKEMLKNVNSKTGRIHPEYWQILKTGRVSVSDPNVNQIPSKGKLGSRIRSAFVPEKGNKIVGGDYSGCELRIIAEFSKDPLWLKVFNEGGDLHSELCAATFDIPISDVKKPFPPKPDLTYRDVQKTIDFGLAYGMSKFKLASTMQISVEEADKIIKKFFKAVPKVDKFLNFLARRGVEKGRIRTGPHYSRIRWFPEHKYIGIGHPDEFKLIGEIERASKNSPIQGANANIIKIALVKVQEAIENEGWPAKIILSVYDEIQTECEESKAEEWCKRLEQLMVEAGEEIIKSIPVVVDCGINDYWSK